MSEKYIEVGGKRIRYLQEGSGRPLVLLHGWSFNADTWVEAGIFQRLAAQFEVYAVDMPYGVKSRSEHFKASRPEYAKFLRQILDALGLADPPLVGPSASGEVVLWYLAFGFPARAAVVVGPVGLVGELLEKLRNVETPILAVWGERDDISPPRNAELLRARNVKTYIIRGAGHAAYLDKPEEFLEVSMRFLQEVY